LDQASGSYLFCGSSFWKLFILWIQLLEVIYSVDPASGINNSVDPASGSYLFCGSSFWKLLILWIQLLEVIYSGDPASGS
jgi:hypothetical protein